MVSRGTAHGILHVGTVKVGQIEVPYYSVDSAHIMLLKVQGTSKNKRVRLAKVFPNDGGKTQTQSEIYKAPKNERNYLNTVSPSFFFPNVVGTSMIRDHQKLLLHVPAENQSLWIHLRMRGEVFFRQRDEQWHHDPKHHGKHHGHLKDFHGFGPIPKSLAR